MMHDRTRDVELTALSLLDRPVPEIVDELLGVVRAATGAEGARFNVLSSRYQYTLADTEGAVGVIDLEESMCVRVVGSSERTHLVPDTREDERFREVGFVLSGQVQAYAASQLVTSTGIPIGTLCIYAANPREWDERTLQTLEAVASTFVRLVEGDRARQSSNDALVRLVRESRELRRSNEHLTAFAGQVSHDLRGPLSAVSLGLELIEEQLDEATGAGSSEEGRLHVETLHTLLRSARGGAARAMDTVGGLLDYATAGGELHREPVDVEQLVDETLADLVPRGGATSVVVDSLPTVQADRVQLRAVLQNLLSNAFKHALKSPATVVVDSVTAPGVVRLQVHDSGEGVPTELREEIFRRGVRGADAIASGREGLGIGLDTCRRVLTNHGGRIGVETSERLGGACFWVELPVSRALGRVGEGRAEDHDVHVV